MKLIYMHQQAISTYDKVVTTLHERGCDFINVYEFVN